LDSVGGAFQKDFVPKKITAYHIIIEHNFEELFHLDSFFGKRKSKAKNLFLTPALPPFFDRNGSLDR